MREACSLIWSALVLLFRSRASLAAEILVLRHQINILRRHSPKRQTFSAMDRLIFAGLYRLAPTVLNALAIVKPETVIKWLCLSEIKFAHTDDGRQMRPTKTTTRMSEALVATRSIDQSFCPQYRGRPNQIGHDKVARALRVAQIPW